MNSISIFNFVSFKTHMPLRNSGIVFILACLLPFTHALRAHHMKSAVEEVSLPDPEIDHTYLKNLTESVKAADESGVNFQNGNVSHNSTPEWHTDEDDQTDV